MLYKVQKNLYFSILFLIFLLILIDISASKLDPISLLALFSSILKLQASLILINSIHFSSNLNFQIFLEYLKIFLNEYFFFFLK